MQTKTTVRYHDISSRMANIQKTQSLKSWQEFRAARNIVHCFGNANHNLHCGLGARIWFPPIMQPFFKRVWQLELHLRS